MSSVRTPARAAPLAALAALLAAAFIGRAVISADGSWVLSETLGFVVTGRFEAATIQQPGEPAPRVSEVSSVHSKYGLFPSLVPLPFVAAAWPLRGMIGGRGLDAAVSLTWTAGVALAALGFVRLARVLRPGASLWWASALVAGTFLWPYAADSFIEPWAAAAFASGAAILLSPRAAGRREGAFSGALVAIAFLLKPVLWVTAPVWLLAALRTPAPEGRRGRLATGFAAALAGALALAGIVNLVREGAILEAGYGSEALAFSTPLGEGLLGLTLLPGRGIFLFAPIAVLALFAARRLTPASRILLYGVPAIHLLVVSRWWAWHGGSAWGPRLLLPVLPLLAAPAVLESARRVVPFVLLGALLNVSGVVVSAGEFISYAERLRAPARSAWPAPGSDRVSTIAALTPLWGHPWLFFRGALGLRLPAPWIAAGAEEGAKPPSAEEFLSPLAVRRVFGLPPVSPFLPRLLVRSAWGWALRGRPEKARLFLKEAIRLDPGDPDARRLREALGP